MPTNIQIPEIDLRKKLAELDAMEAKVRNLMRTLSATSDGQVRHAPIWKDMISAVSAGKVPASSAPTLTGFGSGLRQEYAFAVGDYIWIQPFHVNHDILRGAPAYPHVHWTQNGSNTNSVKWRLEIHRAKGHGQETFNTTPTEIFIEQTPVTPSYHHMVAECSDNDALILTEPDELIMITLQRVTNGATDNTNNIFGLTVDLHYQAATIGTINKAPNFYL